ncbi:hypothetical protein B296_00018195 [Ensete ventricosum]|uniref:Uncharacterized protein n=1 Tax=Ensete ventricosum TaxID=4639 RepID=A0A427B2I5_ENSVE|nr:hypothetical protein B296_00018195 [Ensete ventricosum]
MTNTCRKFAGGCREDRRDSFRGILDDNTAGGWRYYHLAMVVPPPPYFHGAFGSSTTDANGSAVRAPVLRKALNFGSNLKPIGIYKYPKFSCLEKQMW